MINRFHRAFAITGYVLLEIAIAVAGVTKEVSIINGPMADRIERTSAVILWTTDIKSSSIVHYGTSAVVLEEESAKFRNRTMHEIRLENLRPNTTYFFRAQSAVAIGPTAKSRVLTFTTRP